MLSQHMRLPVKSMVKRNIRKNNILTRVFAKLENSRSSMMYHASDSINHSKRGSKTFFNLKTQSQFHPNIPWKPKTKKYASVLFWEEEENAFTSKTYPVLCAYSIFCQKIRFFRIFVKIIYNV